MSSYGWTYLSRDALRRAESQLSGAGEGVRDEIGFLIIHQRYADHFFPGTSVLHTRMRYALFVPWIYQTLYEEGASGRVQDSLQKAEIKLAGRLRHERGAIGGDNYPRPTSQPASVSYTPLPPRGLRPLQIQKYPGYTLSASGLSSNQQEVVLAKQLSLIRSRCA
jgi:hypothetical protein